MGRRYGCKEHFGLLVMLVLVASAACGDEVSDLWVEMGRDSASEGGISNDAGESLFPAIAIGADNHPVVCWTNDDGVGPAVRQQIHVKRWNGANWVEMGTDSAWEGGISNNRGESTHPDIVVDREGNPIVCWRDEEGTRFVRGQIYVRRWNGSSWAEMGKGSASGRGISSNKTYSSYPSIAIGSDNEPIICWARTLGDKSGEICVRRWDGSTWREMGKSLISLDNTGPGVWSVVHPKIAVDLNGNPIICWAEYASGNWEIYVKRWDGSGWVEMGKGSASGGGISNNTGSSVEPAIAVGGDNEPVVCWRDRTSGNAEVYVRRWSGATWVEIGSGSGSRGGISHDGQSSMHPDIAIGPDGNPAICWTSGEIYVKRWDGASWVEVGKGSATGGGISNNSKVSGNPAIVIDSDGNAVVVWWNGTACGDREIFVRQKRK
jgi:hypothetical protein